jgi:hypothetical protein
MAHAHRQNLIIALENVKQSVRSLVRSPIIACGLELPEENLLSSFQLHSNHEINIPVSKKVWKKLIC